MFAQTPRKRPKPDEKRRPSPGFRSHLPGFRGYQGQIRHSCSHQQLEQGLAPADVTRLADAQLHQARQAMLGGLPHLAIGLKLRAVLKGPRLLQQGFLGMELDRAAPVGFGLDALRAQRTGGAGFDRKGKRFSGLLLPFLVQPKPGRDQAGGGVSGRAGASHGFQIDPKLALVDLILASRVGHFGDQLAVTIGKLLTGISIPKSAVAHRLFHLQAGIVLAGFGQGQGWRGIRRIARQNVHPGNQLAFVIHPDGRFMPVKAPGTALTSMPHFGVMHRHNPIPADAFLQSGLLASQIHILVNQLLQ